MSSKGMSLADRSSSKTERLFAMLLLLQTKPNLTSKDLAEHFGMSRRTVFRYIRALEEAGVPLTYSDDGGGYEILSGYNLPPLMFTAREAATLLIGTKFADLQPDASLKKDAQEVELKIRKVLPKDIQTFIDRLRDHTILNPYWANIIEESGDSPDEQGLWYDLSESMAKRTCVMIDYYVSGRDETTRRKVNPLGIVYYFDHWNLIGYCHLRKGIRNFRFDGIKRMFKMAELFTPPADFDLQQHLKDNGASPIKIQARFSPAAYRLARRRMLGRVASENVLENGWTQVTFSFENLDYAANWFLQYGTNCVVESPEILREKVRDNIAFMLQQYSSEVE